MITNIRVVLDTNNGNTVDANGIITEAVGTPLAPAPTILHEGAATNYALQSDAPATQSIILAAGTYTVWLDDSDGLGSIVLSGDATGTATAAFPLTFVSSGASVTFTHSGANNIRWQIEDGSFRTSYIATTTAPISRSADNITLPLAIGSNFYQDKGILLFRFIPEYDSTIIESPLFGIFDGVSVLSSKLKSTDGTTSIDSLATYSKGDDVLASVTWNAAESLFSVSYSLDGGATWAAWASGAYDGAFSSGLNINLFYTSAYVNKLRAAQVYYPDTSYNIASMQAWVESNAGAKT